MTKIAKEGPGIWRMIHYHGNRGKDNIDECVAAVSCDYCKRHSATILPGIRRRYAGDIFRIGVEFHNAVNVKLGKPTFTVEQAREALGVDPIIRKNSNEPRGAGCAACKRPRVLQRRK